MIVSAWTIMVAVFAVLFVLGGIVAFMYATAYLVPNMILGIRRVLRQPMGQQTPIHTEVRKET